MFCKKCGKEIVNEAVVCVHCGVSTGIPLKAMSQPGAGVRMLLPVGRSGYAIAAGYLAFFSVLLIPAPFALIFGILGMRDIKKDQNKHGKGRAIFGIIMGAIGSILIILLIIMGIIKH